MKHEGSMISVAVPTLPPAGEAGRIIFYNGHFYGDNGTVWLQFDLLGAGGPVQLDKFITNGTWVKSGGAKQVLIQLVGGGGGGGGGFRGITTGFGGGGGQGGRWCEMLLQAADLPATVSVIAGNPGGGGIGGSYEESVLTPPGNGSAGSHSAFGDFARAEGGARGMAGSGAIAGAGGGDGTSDDNLKIYYGGSGGAGGGGSIQAVSGFSAPFAAGGGGGGGSGKPGGAANVAQGGAGLAHQIKGVNIIPFWVGDGGRGGYYISGGGAAGAAPGQVSGGGGGGGEALLDTPPTSGSSVAGSGANGGRGEVRVYTFF